METISVSKSAAISVYNERGKKVKQVLEELMGKEVFVGKIIDRIKTFEDVLAACGETEEAFSGRTQEDSSDELAYKQVKLIAQALNEGWTPDWSDSSQYKYYCWFKYAGSGVGFSFYGYDCGHSISAVGSRLVFKSRELAEYAAKQFEAIYNQLFQY